MCNLNEPKVLIVSNNVLSTTSNNGKTLASFFSKFNNRNVAQLFFKDERPDNEDFSNYFLLSDKDVLFKKEGHIVTSESQNKNNLKTKDSISHGNLARLLREGIWKLGKWNTDSLDRWLDEFSPDIVFFCAGDSAFAYDIVDYIVNKYSSKLAIYITDDYILPRKKSSFIWKIRRHIVFSKMSKLITKSDLFFTVSDLMRSEYYTLFKKDSHVISNFQNFYDKKKTNYFDDEYVNLVYAGGLHFKRDHILLNIAESLNIYNENASKKAILHIYTNYDNKSKLFGQNVPSSLVMHSFVDENELKIILNSCDIPVHVEAFDLNSIESTRLSLSTKISEYLSLKKPILAVGPPQIASMKYLENVAFCINDESQFNKGVSILLNNIDLQKKLSKKANDFYTNRHDETNQKEKFYELLCDLA